VTTRRKPARHRPAASNFDMGALMPPPVESEPSPDAALHAVPVPTVLVAADGHALSCNQAWTEFAGWSSNDVTQRSWLDTIHPSSRGDALTAIATARRRSDVITGEWRLAEPDVEVMRTASARIRRRDDGNLLVVVWETTGQGRGGVRRATHDPLTGLISREVLADNTRQAIDRLGKHSPQLTFLLVDLDDFKTLNQKLGRLVGDRVLVAVGAALAAAIRPGDSIARVSGDSFGVLCEGTTNEDAAAITQRLRTAVAQPIDFGDVSVEVDATVGVARTRESTDSFDTLLERADRSVYFSRRTRTASLGGPAPEGAPLAANVRALIVDDQHMVAEALMLSLQQHGFTHVALARTPTYDGVLAAARDFAPDVALVDSQMAGNPTSLALIQVLNEMGIAVVMLIGGGDSERSALCLEAGAIGIFDKSRPLEELMVLLTDAAMGRTLLQPASRDALLEVVRSQREEAERRLAPFQALTSREQAVLAAMMDGKSAKVIAKEHNVSLATIRTQIRSILQKLGVSSQLAAVALAIRAGWEPAD
jgi:two-component system, NarL family, nitrate/nitrite response regulator NarL